MIDVRALTADEVPAFREAMMATFGFDDEADPDGTARTRALLAPAQMWAAFDDATVVATAAAFDLALGLPGGASLPMAGLTMVTVRPTHRRRGLLRQLVAAHLADARNRGFAISGLWASEATIYGRFGYGIAAHSDALEITDTPGLAIAVATPDATHPLDEATARRVLSAIYDAATATRPGVLRRSETWWRERRFLEAPMMRRGASRRRYVVARRGARDVGYLVYRQRPGSLGGRASGRVELVELIAVDATAEATLWRFACALDLFPIVAWSDAPTDCPVSWLVDDPRRVQRTRIDSLWLRIEDVATALAARHYPSEGVLTLAIDDVSWQLAALGGRGRCTPSTGPAQLRLARSTLGALYLGGTPASQLARAGLVDGDPAALALADRLFASPIAPWCPEVF